LWDIFYPPIIIVKIQSAAVIFDILLSLNHVFSVIRGLKIKRGYAESPSELS